MDPRSAFIIDPTRKAVIRSAAHVLESAKTKVKNAVKKLRMSRILKGDSNDPQSDALPADEHLSAVKEEDEEEEEEEEEEEDEAARGGGGGAAGRGRPTSPP